MAIRITRRRFARGAVGGVALALAGRRVLGANSRLQHACVGVGGMMGYGNLRSIGGHKQVDIVAICDVDAGHLARAGEFAKSARRYADWRELLDKEGDKIDSINVTVPDHMHAAITMSALRRKKHVYCQKPLTHDVYESRMIAAAAKSAGVVTQLGTQVAAGAGDKMGVAYLKQGAVGKIKRLILCSNRPGAVQSYRLKGPRPATGSPPPAELSWDLWLGTAPLRDYTPGIYHPVKWRAWQDFGTGWSGDIGCHVFDPVWKGLGLTAPKTVVAEVQESWKLDAARRGDTWPQGDHITWVFPANDLTDGDLTVEWFDGEYFPPDDVRKLASDFKTYPAESGMAIGTEGAVLIPHGGGARLYPTEKFKSHPRPDVRGSNHYHDFVNACLGGPPTASHFMQTGPMAETILLGTVAIRTPGTTLQWDAANMKFPNCPAAEKFLRRTYRKGWQVEGL